MRFVVDSSIWIKLLRKERRVGNQLRRAIAGGDEVIVTPIAYFEVLRGLKKRNDQKSISFIQNLWNDLAYEEAHRQVWDKAIDLWCDCVKRNVKREDADTILAAFASVMGATIVTADERHFPVFGVPVENWTVEPGTQEE